MKNTVPVGRAAEPTLATAGLRVITNDDGTSLELLSTSGDSYVVNLDIVAEDLLRKDGPRREEGEAIRRWCRDQQHALTGRAR